MLKITYTLSIVVILSLSASCSCKKKEYNAAMKNWIGKTDREVILAFGKPEKQTAIDPYTKLIEERQDFGLSSNITLGSLHGFQNSCRQNFIIDTRTNKVIDVFLIIAPNLYARCYDLLPYSVDNQKK